MGRRRSWEWVRSLAREVGGATSVEYAIMASLIAAVIVVAVATVGQGTLGLFERLTTAWP